MAGMGKYGPINALHRPLVVFKIPPMDMPGVLFDYRREARVGLPEAVFCESKPQEALVALLERFAPGDPPVLFTRLDRHRLETLPPGVAGCYNYDPVSRTAWAATLPPRPEGSVAIVSAGTSDAPVAREAARTLEYLGIRHILLEDCGVSALWRLTERLPELRGHNAVIVVAGMEGALATVAGGLLPLPIFAVPTSVGYGVSAGGRAALSGMLSSCAPGVAVLNIDNGYGAACAACRVVNMLY